jgi:hypothetical protein
LLYQVILGMAWPVNLVGLALFVGLIRIWFSPAGSGASLADEVFAQAPWRARTALLVVAAGVGFMLAGCVVLPRVYVLPAITLAALAVLLVLADFVFARSARWHRARGWFGMDVRGTLVLLASAIVVTSSFSACSAISTTSCRRWVCC